MKESATPGHWYVHRVPGLAKGHPRVRSKEDERAQGPVPCIVRLGPAQVWKEAPLKTLIDPEKRVRNVRFGNRGQKFVSI